MLIKYINRFKRAVKNRKIKAFFLVLGYIVGIILGLVLKGNNDENLFYLFVKNYNNVIFGLYSNPVKLLFTRMLNNLFSFILIYLICYSTYFFFLNLLIFIYRGVILGSVILLFFEILGIQGIVVFIFLVLVQNLIVTFALFFTSIIVYDLKCFCKKKYTDNVYLKYFLIGFIISILVGLYELLMLLCFFRPLNIYF